MFNIYLETRFECTASWSTSCSSSCASWDIDACKACNAQCCSSTCATSAIDDKACHAQCSSSTCATWAIDGCKACYANGTRVSNGCPFRSSKACGICNSKLSAYKSLECFLYLFKFSYILRPRCLMINMRVCENTMDWVTPWPVRLRILQHLLWQPCHMPLAAHMACNLLGPHLPLDLCLATQWRHRQRLCHLSFVITYDCFFMWMLMIIFHVHADFIHSCCMLQSLWCYYNMGMSQNISAPKLCPVH